MPSTAPVVASSDARSPADVAGHSGLREGRALPGPPLPAIRTRCGMKSEVAPAHRNRQLAGLAIVGASLFALSALSACGEDSQESPSETSQPAVRSDEPSSSPAGSQEPVEAGKPDRPRQAAAPTGDSGSSRPPSRADARQPSRHSTESTRHNPSPTDAEREKKPTPAPSSTGAPTYPSDQDKAQPSSPSEVEPAPNTDSG